jgi:uncharacterized protein with GYD domain
MAENSFIVLCTFDRASLSQIFADKPTDVVAAANDAAKMAGVAIADIYFTTGEYDMAILCTAPDNESALTFLPLYSDLGGVTTKSLAASSAKAVIARAQDAHTKMHGKQ